MDLEKQRYRVLHHCSSNETHDSGLQSFKHALLVQASISRPPTLRDRYSVGGREPDLFEALEKLVDSWSSGGAGTACDGGMETKNISLPGEANRETDPAPGFTSPGTPSFRTLRPIHRVQYRPCKEAAKWCRERSAWRHGIGMATLRFHSLACSLYPWRSLSSRCVPYQLYSS